MAVDLSQCIWKYLLDMTKAFGDYKQYARGEVIDNSGNNLKVRYEVMLTCPHNSD